MAQPLPEYKRPPVIEVVLSVQFDKLESMHTAQLGCVWQTFRKRLPKTEEQPPLEPVFETFGMQRDVRGGVRFEIMASPPIPRLWFVNHSGTDLVQVQQDRFIRNWRKREDDDTYPRYSRIREAFREDFGVFCKLIDVEGWGVIEPNQCEVTYVNLIPTGEGWQHHGELDRVCTLFAVRYSAEDLGPPEEVSIRAKYLLRDAAGSPIGRLHIAADPVYGVKDQQPAIRLTLTARGAPIGEGIDGVFEFMDRGHDAIVRTFTSITTAQMHGIWERTR